MRQGANGARLLAKGDLFAIQAFGYGAAAYGIQFHAEVTHAMMCRWTTRGHERLSLPGAKSRPEHFADRPVYDAAIRAWLADFLDHWMAQAPAVAVQAFGHKRRERLAAMEAGHGLAQLLLALLGHEHGDRARHGRGGCPCGWTRWRARRC